MSCYFRHIKGLFQEAGLTISPENKKDVDLAIHKMVGVEYKDCSTTWRRLKEKFLANDKGRKRLVQELKRLSG
jgi:hypothetical protein